MSTASRSPVPFEGKDDREDDSLSEEELLESRVFIKFYSKLIIVFRDKDYLPHLVTTRIISPDNVHHLSGLLPRDKAMRVLEYVSDSLDGGDKECFNSMLEIMRNHGNSYAQNLAEKITKTIDSAVDCVASLSRTESGSMGSVASFRSDKSTRSDGSAGSARSDSMGCTSTGEVSSFSTSAVNSINFDECNDISLAFSLLTAEITKLLKRANFPTLRRVLLQQRKFPRGIQFPDDLHQSIKEAQDFDTLLDVLVDSDYWSWVELRLLEAMVASSGINEANCLLKKYKESIFSKKLSEVLDKLPFPPQKEYKEAYITKVGSKIQKKPDDVTVGDLSLYCDKLEKVIMDINNGYCVLEHLDKGCHEIHWLNPAHRRFHAYKSVLSNRHKFSDVHLQYLHIEPCPSIYNPFTIQPTMLSTLLCLPKPIALAEYYRIIKTHEINFVRMHEDDFVTVLSNQLAKLKTLSINGCKITDKGKKLIIAFLAKSTLLQIFDMSNAKLNTTKASEIVQVFALTKTAAIQSLDISRNCITADFIEDLISALAQCNTLEELNLSHNLLTFTSIIKIAEGLRGHHNLKNLNLSENLISFHSEAEFLVDVILSTNQSLVYLNICGRNIRPRFSNDHLFPPPNTELQSDRFPLQNLYLSRLPSSDMFTFKSREMHMPENFIKANQEEYCPILCQNIASYYVDHNGGTFYNQDHDFAIVAPPGAVLQGDCVEIRATAGHFGCYKLPKRCHPVSSFFWISSKYTFKIPVYLIMSHYAVIESINEMNNLCVFQAPACIRNPRITDEEKLMMNEVSNSVYFDCKIRYCVLKTEHFCSYSVGDRIKGRFLRSVKVLCYHYKQDDKDDEDTREKFYTAVCIYPNSCDCNEIVAKQCRNTKLEKDCLPPISFANRQSFHIPDEFSTISGWYVRQIGNPKICYSNFKYWKKYKSREAFQEALDKNEYPPRLLIRYLRDDLSAKLQYTFCVVKKKN